MEVAAAAAVEQKSPLYKPLCELTEDDIVQVTREDCRRFLKEKGMRRPSWNKSQAIQQVISLKALLEPNDAAGHSSPSPPDHQKTLQFSSAPPPPPDLLLPTPLQEEEKKELSTDGGSRSQQRRDPPVEITGVSPRHHYTVWTTPLIGILCNARCGEVVGSETGLVSVIWIGKRWWRWRWGKFGWLGNASRITGESAEAPALAGQMTVFYGDEVNVFDGVLVDKALAIMRIAASPDYHSGPFSNVVVDLNQPFNFPQPKPVQAMVPPPAPVNNAIAKSKVKFPSCLHDGNERKIPREFEPEGQTCRKASLQRYLEKRKDRKIFKCKRNTEGLPSSSTMDLYFTQKFSCENSNGKQCQCVSTVNPHPKSPQRPTHYTSAANHTQNVQFSFDLNNADVQK